MNIVNPLVTRRSSRYGRSTSEAESLRSSGILSAACPLKIVKLLTDNGNEFRDRLFASRAREPTGSSPARA
jgi:hypothetical protein